MKAWKVIQGNTSQQDIPIKDKNGALVDDLASATTIKFQVKEPRNDTLMISKEKGDGIEVDTPDTGYLRVTLLPEDTNIRPADTYIMALQLEWSANEKYETKMKIDNEETDRFIVEKGVIS